VKKVRINKKIFYTELSKVIIKIINKKRKAVNIFFTGGNSAKKTYFNIFQNLKSININSRVNIYQTDERIFEKKENKNSENIKNNFIKKINEQKIKFYPMIINNKKLVNSSTYYNCYNNSKIDLILLTLGDDGHVASLSKNDENIFKDKILCYTKYNSKKINRVTISTKFFNKAENIFIICNGKKKQEMYKIFKKKEKYFKRLNILLKRADFYFD